MIGLVTSVGCVTPRAGAQLMKRRSCARRVVMVHSA